MTQKRSSAASVVFLGVLSFALLAKAGLAVASTVWTDGFGDGFPDGDCFWVGPEEPIVVDVWLDSESFIYSDFQITVEHAELSTASVQYVISGGLNAPIDSTSRPNSLIFSGSGYNLQGVVRIASITFNVEDFYCAFARPVIDAADAFPCRLTSSAGAECFFDTRGVTCFTLAECFDLSACCLPDGSCFTTYNVCKCLAEGGQFLGCATDCGNCPTATGVPSGRSSTLEVLPNPSAAGVRITFRVQYDGEMDLSIYDGSGRRIRTLVSGRIPTGLRFVAWDGRDSSGHEVGPGVYFLRLRDADGHEVTERVTIVR